MNSIIINLVAYLIKTINTNPTTREFIKELGKNTAKQIPHNLIEKELGEVIDVFKEGLLSEVKSES